MRGEPTAVKKLKEFDDTKPAPPKNRKRSEKMIGKPKPRGRSFKIPKLLPGQVCVSSFSKSSPSSPK